MGSQRLGHNFHFHLAILFNLYRNHHVLHSGYTFLHLQQCARTPFLISTYSCQHLLFPFFFFNTSHPDDGEVVSHCNFYLHVSKISNAEHFFMWLLAICVFSLEKYLYKFFVQVSCRQHIIGSCVFLHSFNLCLLIGGFNQFTFIIITDESESVNCLVMSNSL